MDNAVDTPGPQHRNTRTVVLLWTTSRVTHLVVHSLSTPAYPPGAGQTHVIPNFHNSDDDDEVSLYHQHQLRQSCELAGWRTATRQGRIDLPSGGIE